MASCGKILTYAAPVPSHSDLSPSPLHAQFEALQRVLVEHRPVTQSLHPHAGHDHLQRHGERQRHARAQASESPLLQRAGFRPPVGLSVHRLERLVKGETQRGTDHVAQKRRPDALVEGFQAALLAEQLT